MPRPLVLVTEPEFVRAEAFFTSYEPLECVPAPPADRELAAAVRARGARHAVVGPLQYPEAIYGALPRGAVLARFGVGYDGIDLARATAAGLLCTNTPDVLHQSVAELTMLLIAAAARRLLPMAGGMREGQWLPATGGELAGRTLTIVGTGKIGRTVAQIASRGFQMRVIGCRRPGASQADQGAAFDMVTSDFGAAVAEADYVSLHIPGSPENRHFVDARRLSHMPDRTWLINTARGAVVDERALFEALAGGRIAGAALDVFEHEPYEPVDRARDVRTLANVILLPHVGSNTTAANRRMAERALGNIVKAEAGDFGGMDLLNAAAARQ